MEIGGLGKLSPNMMLIGFQEKWSSCPEGASHYVQTLQSALDLHLAVGIFRVQVREKLSKFVFQKIIFQIKFSGWF